MVRLPGAGLHSLQGKNFPTVLAALSFPQSLREWYTDPKPVTNVTSFSPILLAVLWLTDDDDCENSKDSNVVLLSVSTLLSKHIGSSGVDVPCPLHQANP